MHVRVDFILNRNDVFNICNNNQYPFAYKIASVFSWGGMSGGKNASDLFFKNWVSYKLELEEILVEYSQNLITRNWAYERLNRMNLKGCGPAYFTKLLFYKIKLAKNLLHEFVNKNIKHS